MKDLDMFLIEEEQKMQGGGRTNKQAEQPKIISRNQKIGYCMIAYGYLALYVLSDLGLI